MVAACHTHSPDASLLMATKRHRLFGETSGFPESESQLGPLAVRARRLQGGLSDGLLLVELVAGQTKVFVLPDRGLGIWKILHGSVELGWQSPVRGPVHPSFVPLAEPSGLGWLAGFDELICRCGLLSCGAPEHVDGQLRHGLHGRIANLPAESVEVVLDDEAGTVTLSGVVHETRFLQYALRLSSALTLRAEGGGLRICDTVDNLSDTPAEMQILYHCNFGQPLLGEGAELVAAIEELAPRDEAAVGDVPSWNRYAAARAGRGEQVHFCRLRPGPDGEATALLVAADRSRAACLSWHAATLPCFTLWKNQAGLADGYVTGLEPATNYPNPRSHEASQGRVVSLEAGGGVQFQLGLDLLEGDAVEQEVTRIRSLGAEPLIHAKPKPGWSPPT